MLTFLSFNGFALRNLKATEASTRRSGCQYTPQTYHSPHFRALVGSSLENLGRSKQPPPLSTMLPVWVGNLIHSRCIGLGNKSHRSECNRAGGRNHKYHCNSRMGSSTELG